MKKALFTLILILTGQISTFAQSQDTIPPFYIRLESCRPKSSFPTIQDNGNGTATYKDVNYPINVGQKKGRFILVNGKKKYLPRT